MTQEHSKFKNHCFVLLHKKKGKKNTRNTSWFCHANNSRAFEAENHCVDNTKDQEQKLYKENQMILQ